MAGIPRRLSALALASTLILCSDVIDWLTEQHESPATKETLQPEALVVLMVARLVVGQQVFIMCLVHDAGPDVLGHTRLERVSEPSPCHYHITLLSPLACTSAEQALFQERRSWVPTPALPSLDQRSRVLHVHDVPTLGQHPAAHPLSFCLSTAQSRLQ
jgi:hypothetical protein